MTRLDRWWAGVPKRRKQVVDAAIKREKRHAAAWLAKAEKGLLRQQKGEHLPQERDGTKNICQYKFVTHATGDLNPDDRDGVMFAVESDRGPLVTKRDVTTLVDEEKENFYAGRESSLDSVTKSAHEFPSMPSHSGDLKSTWSLIEGMAVHFNQSGKLRQWRQERADYKDHFVWDWVTTTEADRDVADSLDVYCPQLRLKKIKSSETVKVAFRPTHISLRRQWDSVIKDFRDIPFVVFNPHDPAGLEHERRVLSRKSPRRVESVQAMNDMALATKPLMYINGPVREWDGKPTDPRYREWLESGDYAGLQAYRAMIVGESTATKGLCQHGRRKNGRAFMTPRKVSNFAAA